MRQCYERSDRGRCGCCRVHYRPLRRLLSAPTTALTTAAPSKDPKKTSSPSADAGPLSTPTLFSLLDVDPHSALQLVLPLL
jgi:hypothetical protein